MARIVRCAVLKREAEGLERPPHPGPQEGWKQWLQRLATIINENKLSTADLASIKVIEQHMVGFLFGEGDMGKLPAGFQAPGSKK